MIKSIVAVHGLNPTNRANHAVATWQDSKSGHLWLRDALPLAKPSVRTLLYSYNSSPVFENDKEHSVYQANSLLECLRIDRKKVDIPIFLRDNTRQCSTGAETSIDNDRTQPWRHLDQASKWTFILYWISTNFFTGTRKCAEQPEVQGHKAGNVSVDNYTLEPQLKLVGLD